MEKLTPLSFMDAATEILADRGARELNIVALCARLGISRGSFYHHFKDLADFENRFIEYWEHDVTGKLLKQVDEESSFRDRSEVAARLEAQRDFRVERALRAWALEDPRVAAMLDRVDKHVFSVIKRSVAASGASPSLTNVYSELVMTFHVGLASRTEPLPSRMVRRLYQELEWAAAAQAKAEAKRRSG